jgi:hypothetical protein
MPCPHLAGVRIRPWLLATCSPDPDAAATVPSMGSLDLSEESMTRVGEAPVRVRPPTMSKLSPTEIIRLLLLSCSEVAPQSLSIARVLVVPSAPSPVEVGPSELSPGTETTVMEFPSVSAPVETCITDASHAACSKSVIGIAPVSTSTGVNTGAMPMTDLEQAGSIQDVASVLSSGWPDLSEESLTRVVETSMDLSEEPMARVGPAGFTPPSDRYLSGSLDLSAETMTRGGSHG